MTCSSAMRGLAAFALTVAVTVIPADAQSIVGKDKTGPVPNPVSLDITGMFQAKFASVGDDMFIGGQPTEKALRDLKARGVTTVVNLRMPEEMAQVGFDEAGDEEVAVVVALAQAQLERHAGFRAGLVQQFRLELGVEELVFRALVDQQRRPLPAA